VSYEIQEKRNLLFVSKLAVRHVLSISMCVIINSIEESMPEPGVGVTLKPVAAESEFIVVLFRFPGELLDERPPGSEFMLSAELN
jgi:hypothetical protein